MFNSTIFSRALALLIFVSVSMFSNAQETTYTDIEFTGVFDGTTYDGTYYTTPSGSQSWAGFANEDVSLYPLSFVDGGEITFTGATSGTDVEVYFRFEYNPYPDTEPSFNLTSLTVSGTDGAPYSVEIPAQGTNTYSSFLLYVTTLDAPVSLTDVTLTATYSSTDVYGCTDPSALNYDPTATIDDGSCIYTTVDLNITIDVCGSAAETVRITGPSWGWDPNGGPEASDNGDGTWTVSLPAPTTDMEFLVVTDGVQENLIEDMTDGGSCAPVTDYYSYANRIWHTTDALDVDVNYDRCVPCSYPDVSITSEICEPLVASEVKLVGPPNWDWNSGKLGVDNGDGTWTFTYSPAPSDSIEYQIFVDGLGENLLQEVLDGATCAPSTDFYSYANRLGVITDSETVSNTYNTCLNCEGEGITDIDIKFEVYPNPASDKISLSNVPSDCSFTIYNTVGSRLISGTSTESVDISSLTRGMYFIELTSKSQFNRVSFIKQ